MGFLVPSLGSSDVIILILCCLFCRKKRNDNTEDNDNVEMVDVNKLDGPEQGDKI